MSETNDKASPIKLVADCLHLERSRYTDGFYCRDCDAFFSKDSKTYRSGELLSDIWMVLNNINVDRSRSGLPECGDVAALKEEIGIGKSHDNYEDIIRRADLLMVKYNKTSDSASITLAS
jgi:hypothetical protein